jgi:hypothetical protein
MEKEVLVSGNGVLNFSHLIASDLAKYQLVIRNGPWWVYVVRLTPKG